jgi:hypothetical protein
MVKKEMSPGFNIFSIVTNPIAAFIGWLLCGLVRNDYACIALRSGVLF